MDRKQSAQTKQQHWQQNDCTHPPLLDWPFNSTTTRPHDRPCTTNPFPDTHTLSVPTQLIPYVFFMQKMHQPTVSNASCGPRCRVFPGEPMAGSGMCHTGWGRTTVF